jgi:MFS family permease
VTVTAETGHFTTIDIASVQRRTQRVLMASVVAGGAGMAATFSSAAVLAKELTGSDTLGGMTAATLGLGSAAATLPVARRMFHRGRRVGLMNGWAVGAVGASIAFAAAVSEFFPLLVVGILLAGSGNATNLAARYGAVDLATEDHRARTIGLMVWATLFGSALGPTVALGPASSFAEALGLPELAGPYLMAMLMFGIGAVVTGRLLRPDPLMVARTVGSNLDPERTPVMQVLARIAASSRARLAVAGMVVGHAVMVGVMTMTPLHMEEGDHELKIIGFVISLHVVGMYAFAPVVGWIVDRIGPHLVIAAAGIVLFCGGELAAHTDPEDSTGVFVGLFLIGLGWSFGLVAGSSLLTGAFGPIERVEVQGAADLIMVSSGAVAGLSSGVIVEWTSYHSLSHWAGLLSLLLVGAAVSPLLAWRRPAMAGN